ncbi:transcriptional protein SWT1 isoform X3 [Sceloporus undulatus]|uniref:transcriptional protein SWT1 isoform X3 n=1 Tax=Sceloporus undulatus TaxID=8520 RepID=UPI001C4D0C01|nr:transcriptional protein SWT1 isoform X3 [Sceloporus undulatus]
MAKKHKKSSKKDNASDSKNHEDPKIGSNHVKDHPSQRLDNATRCTKAKNSLSFIEATTKDLQKNISKETQHIGGTLMSPEQREKITIRFKKKADHGGKRSNTDLVAASFSKEDSDRDVYSEPDVKRKRQESHDLRILNTRKKKIKDKAEHSSVKNIIVRSMLPKECSFLPKKKSLKLDEFSIKQNSSKEPYLPTSAVNLSGPKLHMQACREETLEKSKRTSLQHPSNKDEMRYKPLRPVMDQSNFLKYKEKKQLCNDSTNNVCHLRTQRSKYEPVAFQANQSSETSCHPFSAFEATENTDPDQEMRIVEVLHAARIGQKMALPVVQTCGELTSMDIDLPDDESNKFAKSVAGLNTLIVVDTNIMIRHLEFIKSLKNSVIPDDFIVENNDDRVLQCCLQYKNLFPQVEIVLLTDDKNLCNKALVSEIKACSKIDLVTALQKLVPKNVVITQDASICQSLLGKDTSCHKVEASSTDDLSVIILDTKKCLGKVLSSILETELKIAYGELWTEVVYHNPPWTLDNVLDCYKKHWMAVFGMVIPRSFFSTIEYLYEHLCKAEIIQGSTITFVLQESKMLLETFSSRSNYDGVLSQAITEVDKLLETLKKQGTEPDTSGVLKSTSGETACEKMEDVAFIQNTQTVDKSLSSKPLAKGNRHMEIWSVLQILWDRINGFSLQVFQKLDLSSVTTTEKMASFKEAFVDLQKLMSGVNEILSGIQKVLLPNSSFQDIWTLYNFLINAEVNNDTKFTAEELYECISQKVYRDRLSIGWGQLVQLEHTIKQCYESVCLEIKNRGWL